MKTFEHKGVIYKIKKRKHTCDGCIFEHEIEECTSFPCDKYGFIVTGIMDNKVKKSTLISLIEDNQDQIHNLKEQVKKLDRIISTNLKAMS